MLRRLLLMGLAIGGLVAPPARAIERGCSTCRQHCPRCQAVCELKISKDEETRTGWDVECKPICIPRVRFPWQSCDAPLTARVRYVKSLKKVEWKCPTCKYQWQAKECKCDRGASEAGQSQDASEAPPPRVVPADAAPAPPAPPFLEPPVPPRPGDVGLAANRRAESPGSAGRSSPGGRPAAVPERMVRRRSLGQTRHVAQPPNDLLGVARGVQDVEPAVPPNSADASFRGFAPGSLRSPVRRRRETSPPTQRAHAPPAFAPCR